MSLSRQMRALFCVLGAALMSGCYSYFPVERPAPGSIARIQVPVRSAVPRPNASPESISMEGLVLSASDSVVLAVSSRRVIGAYREISSVDTVRVARADLSALETRVFSRGKSIGLGVVIVSSTVGLAALAFGLRGGTSGENGDGNGSTTSSSIRINPLFAVVLQALGR
jgi:hypothetical protein